MTQVASLGSRQEPSRQSVVVLILLVHGVPRTVAVRDSHCEISNHGSQWRRVEICSYSVHALQPSQGQRKHNSFIVLIFYFFVFSSFSFIFSFFHYFIISLFSYFQFFHYLHVSSFFFSFSFSFLGCSKSDFFGLDCFKISCNISVQKIMTSLGFLFFLLSIYIFPFLFLSYYFLLVIFSQEKSFFFSFFLYFFQICVFLLALVSEFNCFFRCRCSMEMWCPDDTGRESWDWVGPPAWERACFNSPEWGGGSSPVKTEPPQIVFVVVVVWLCGCFCVVCVVCCSFVCRCCGCCGCSRRRLTETQCVCPHDATN